MRSSAVGIDKQQNGLVTLGNFPVLFLNFFMNFSLKRFSVETRPQPCWGLPRASVCCVWDPAELGPHNARFYYGIVLGNGSNVRGTGEHVTNVLQF
jgi:hypothetical protein